MWQDWQGTTPAVAKQNLASLQAAKITGQPTSIRIAGVETQFNTSSEKTGMILQELQKYIFEIEVNGYDWQSPRDPYAERPGITRARFC